MDKQNEAADIAFVGLVCPDPGTPINGRRQLESQLDGASVHYGCRNGFTLIGDTKRTCFNGQWTGGLPVCIGTWLNTCLGVFSLDSVDVIITIWYIDQHLLLIFVDQPHGTQDSIV